MGGKSDMANREDRPESGGTDPDGIRSKTGLQEREKQKFAVEEAEKRAQAPEQHPDQAGQPALPHEPFSVGHERNPLK
jgi:hypothetical protein